MSVPILNYGSQRFCKNYRLTAGTYPVLCAYSIFCRKIRFFAFSGDIFLLFGQ